MPRNQVSEPASRMDKTAQNLRAAGHVQTDRTAELLRKYDLPVPRYTSYPTAPHFSQTYTQDTFAQQVADIPADAQASLYVHLPFCKSLCWYCGCTMKVAHDVETMLDYSDAVSREIGIVAALLGRKQKVGSIHLGGGTPTWCPRDSLITIMRAMRDAFEIREDAEIAMEIDPRTLTDGMAVDLARLGVNRVSLGVQDFNVHVQEAINRVQPLSVVERALAALRDAGITRINLDLIYGLPLQTEAGIAETVDLAMKLQPQRIALFGYAHVPWMKKHQRLLERHALPDAAQRYGLFCAAQERIVGHGLRQIGIDHFAQPDDELARAAEAAGLNRNFQGYTTDVNQVLFGFGASAISALPFGYAQNNVSIKEYVDEVRGGRLATARGRVLTDDDLRRRKLIMNLMCDFEVTVPSDLIDEAAPVLAPLAEDGLFTWEKEYLLKMTKEGRPWVRVVAACFDAYYKPAAMRHARAV